MEDLVLQHMSFVKALREAEKEGRNEFICPICGGNAVWCRSAYNNHLRCKCDSCGIQMIE